MLQTTVVAVFLLTTLLFTVHGQRASSDEWDESIWKSACDFILQYHSQWPIRRAVMVYHPLKGRENYMKDLAMELFVRLSKVGVSSSFVRIPDPNAVAGLRVKEQNQPPVHCILILTPNDATAGFIREVADAGGTTGDRISWMHLRYGNQRMLTKDIGLRADTDLTTAFFTSKNYANLFRWNGLTHTERVPWEGPGKPVNPDITSQPNMDLTGQQLSVAVFDDPPFVYAPNATGAISEAQLSGWLIDIWKDVQGVLKFKSTYYKPMRVDPSVGIFKRAVEELRSGRADLILYPFVVTANVLDQAEFSMPVINLRYRFLLPRVTASSSIDQFVKPFQVIVWRIIAGIWTFAVALMTLTYILGRYYEYEEEGFPIFQLRESVMMVYGSLFAQGPDFAPLSYSGRMVLWMSFLFAFLVNQWYSAALISKLTVGTLEPPFTTLEGMLDSKYTVIYTLDSAPHRLVTDAIKGSWKEMGERKPYPRHISRLPEAVTEVSNSWTETTLLETKERILPLINREPYNCKTTMLSTDIMKAPGQFMLSKDSPYKSAIDQQLISMRASGRLHRARSSWLGRFFDEPCSKDTTLPQFGLDSVILPFAILLATLGASVLFLAIEMAIKKWLGKLLKEDDWPSALQEIAKTKGMRISKHWKKVQDNMVNAK